MSHVPAQTSAGTPGSRPTRPGVRELRRRASGVHRRVGAQVVELRLDAGLKQAELARCAGIAPSYLWKVEAGLASPSMDVLVAIGACLGADLGVRYFPGTGPRLHDRFQAPMIDALIRLVADDWRPQPEVAVPGARGVIDLVLRRPSGGLAIACECHSELRRLELVLRRLAEKTEALRGQLPDEMVASSLLLLRSTAATRAISRAYEATLAAAFPARSRDALAALTGDMSWPGPALIWARVDRARAEILQGPPRGVRLGR